MIGFGFRNDGNGDDEDDGNDDDDRATGDLYFCASALPSPL